MMSDLMYFNRESLESTFAMTHFVKFTSRRI